MKPRAHFFSLTIVAGLLAITSGCLTSVVKKDKSKPERTESEAEYNELTLIGDLARTWGLHYRKIENVALVTGLDNTGSDPPPSPQRQILINDMQARGVDSPNKVLASPTTSLVLVRAYLPPGIQQDDPFDLEVQIHPRSETTSLRGGWLMPARLKEVEILGNTLHEGHVYGVGEGQVLVDGVFETGDSAILEVKGRVLGGGRATKSRPLGLVLKDDHTSVKTSAKMAAAINGRFFRTEGGIKKGVATAKRDNYIELEIDPRYKHNISRFVRVVSSLPLQVGALPTPQRLELLERQLLEPTTAGQAALKLEALGQSAVNTLEVGLHDKSPEVRFYSAEALAYLDVASAAPVLSEAAAAEPAFRWHALTALASMDHVEAYDALNELLQAKDQAARYGALQAMRARNALDPLVRGEVLHGEFRYHVINSNEPPLIHFTQAKYPEVALFGHAAVMRPPSFLYAGPQILIKGTDDNRIKITRFSPGKEDLNETCSTRVDDIIRTVTNLGGGYEEVMAMLQEARQRDYLTATILVDALTTSKSQESEAASTLRAATPLPELFQSRFSRQAMASTDRSNIEYEPEPKPGFFGKMKGLFSQ